MFKNFTPLPPDPWLSRDLIGKIAFVQAEASSQSLDCAEAIKPYLLISDTDALAIVSGWKQVPDPRKMLLSNLVLAAAILQNPHTRSPSIEKAFNLNLAQYLTL